MGTNRTNVSTPASMGLTEVSGVSQLVESYWLAKCLDRRSTGL